MRRALALLALLPLAACGGAGESRWERVTSPPLTPRVPAATFSSGPEAFVVGGDTEPCPPNAGCVLPRTPPLADGAAYDARTGEWRRIADAPVPFEFADVELLGETAYLWIVSDGRPGTSTAFLAYRIADDRWDELPLPPSAEDADEVDVDLVQADGRLVTLTFTDAGDAVPADVLDPAAETWAPAPDGLAAAPRSAPRDERLEPHEVAGWIGRYTAPSGWALDEETGEWIEIEPLEEDDEWVDERAVASAGRDLLVVGGVRWEGLEPRLLNDAWLWRAP